MGLSTWFFLCVFLDDEWFGCARTCTLQPKWGKREKRRFLIMRKHDAAAGKCRGPTGVGTWCWVGEASDRYRWMLRRMRKSNDASVRTVFAWEFNNCIGEFAGRQGWLVGANIGKAQVYHRTHSSSIAQIVSVQVAPAGDASCAQAGARLRGPGAF